MKGHLLMTHIHTIIIGAGGTGGHLFDRIARLAYGMNIDVEKPDMTLTLVDGDRVEENNLLRQNFTLDDLGENKATALANRYYDQMGIATKVSTDYLTTPLDVINLLDSEASMNIIVGAVDNHTARYQIEQAMVDVADAYNAVWLDSGNMDRFGQVIVSGSYKALRIAELQAFDSNFQVPQSPFEKYPDSFMDFSGLNGDVTQLSCELSAISSPQNIATNIIAADTVFMLINKLINNEFITNFEYKFDTNDLGVVAAK